MSTRKEERARLSWYREPLLHFLTLGLMVFVVYEYCLEPPADPKRIHVSQENILAYMQYRAKSFDADNAQRQLESMSAANRAQLIDAYVREEVMYREAKALQLDKNDYHARQRLVQQMRYLTQRLVEKPSRLTDEELRRYRDAHEDRFIKPAHATFTHVFISLENRSDEDARAMSSQLNLMVGSRTLSRSIRTRRLMTSCGLLRAARLRLQALQRALPADPSWGL